MGAGVYVYVWVRGGGFNTMQYLLFLQQNRIELEQMKKLKIMNDT